jgi:hypothetical protein
MRKSFGDLLRFSILVLTTSLVQAQVDDATLAKWVSIYKATDPADRSATFANAGFYVPTLSVIQEGLMHGAEENRLDKQTESAATVGGGTSAVNKGSVPWLFAFALEHGALTQSVDGNLVTMRGNIANIIKALSARDYLTSYELGQDNLFVRAVSAASFAVSFNTSSGNASPTFSSNSISNASAHLDIYNRRDPRDRKWRSAWVDLAKSALVDVATARGRFTTLIQTNHSVEFQTWRNAAIARLAALPGAATDQEVQSALQEIAKDFANTFGKLNDVRESGKQVLSALAAYSAEKKTVTSLIDHSPVLSFDYSYSDQSTVTLPSSPSQTFSVNQTPPSLSGVNLTFAGYLLAGSQFAVNASADLFNSTVPGTGMGRVRDYRLSGQIEVPLPEIPNLGKSSISFSGVFLALLEEPLGQQVLVNAVPVSTKGNIGLFQAKWTIPIKGAGVRIPLSFTSSNRTELIKESEKRGSIGISFDLDNLFSRP